LFFYKSGRELTYWLALKVANNCKDTNSEGAYDLIALDLAHTKKEYGAFMKLMCKVVEESFEPYFFVLGINQ